jgi:hypothetical protein
VLHSVDEPRMMLNGKLELHDSEDNNIGAVVLGRLEGDQEGDGAIRHDEI